MLEINRLAKKVIDNGVDYVLVSPDGVTLPFRQAYREFRIVPDFALIRKDGWSLGIPTEFSNLARKLAGENWFAVLLHDGTVLPYRVWTEITENRSVQTWKRKRENQNGKRA